MTAETATKKATSHGKVEKGSNHNQQSDVAPAANVVAHILCRLLAILLGIEILGIDATRRSHHSGTRTRGIILGITHVGRRSRLYLARAHFEQLGASDRAVCLAEFLGNPQWYERL